MTKKLLRGRLYQSIHESRDLREKQVGVRKGRLIIGAVHEVIKTQCGNNQNRPIVLIVLIDVKNIFNSLRWANKFKISTYFIPNLPLKIWTRTS